MARPRHREAGGRRDSGPDRKTDDKGKGSGESKKQKDNSVEHFKAGLEMTPESLAQDQKRKAHESEMAADKAEIQKLKVKEELKKAREAAGIKDEAVVAAEAAGATPADAAEAKAVVEAQVDEAVEATVEEVPAVVTELQTSGQLTPEQASFAQAQLKAPETRSRIKNFFHRAKESGAWGGAAGFATGVAGKAAIRVGAISALGASFGVILGAGAAAGGAVEAVKAMWRESKRYDYQKNITSLESETDQFKKAAILNKLEASYKEQQDFGTEEDRRMAAEALKRARDHFNAVLQSKDTKFAKESDRNKLQFLLDSSNANRKELRWSERREVKQLLKDMDRSMVSERKASHLKGRWGKVGWAALKGASFGMIGAGAGYALASTDIGPNAWNGLKNALGYATQEKVDAYIDAADKGKDLLSNKEFSHKIGAKGITGAYREMIRDYITQQKTLDPNYAQGLNLERLVYSEDFLKDIALENGTPTGEGVIKATGGELQQAIDQAMQVDEKGVDNIRHLIDGKKHFISKAVRAHMLDWTPGTLANPDNDALSGLAESVQAEVRATLDTSEAMFTGDRKYADLFVLLATNAVVEETMLAMTRERNSETKETATSETVTTTLTETATAEEPVNPENPAPTITGVEVTPPTNEITQEFREQIKQELDAKFAFAGVDVVDLGLVFNNKSSPDKQRMEAHGLADMFIRSFKKYSGPSQLLPLAIEFNFDEDKLANFEHRAAKVGSSGWDGVFLRIPTNHEEKYYKDQFEDFIKKYSKTRTPEGPKVEGKVFSVAEEAADEPEVAPESDKEEEPEEPKPEYKVGPFTDALADSEAKEKVKGPRMSWSEFNSKYMNRDETIKLTGAVKETKWFIDYASKKGVNKELLYGKLDFLLQDMKVKNSLTEDEWGGLKKIEVMDERRETELKPDVLYIHGDDFANLNIDDPGERGKWKAIAKRRIQKMSDRGTKPLGGATEEF